jgi:hypothetical protein
MDFTVYPPPSTAARLVTKSDTSGEVLLSATVSTASTTMGSWVQVTASTAAEYYVTHVSAVQTGGTLASGTVADLPMLVDLGQGAAASEVVRASLAFSQAFYNGTANILAHTRTLGAPLRISSGTRLALRAAKSANTAGGTMNGVLIHLTCVPVSAVEGN